MEKAEEIELFITGDKREEPKNSLWSVYVIGLRCALAHAESFFESFGRLVAYHPWKIVLMALVVVGICGSGLSQMQTESRTSKLFVPQNSLAEKALEKGKQYFQNSLNTRTEEIILLPKDEQNILSIDCLKEALSVFSKVKNISGYENLCREQPGFLKQSNVYNRKETCNVLNPLELLNGKAENMDSIYHKFVYAVSRTNRLMSNGRAGIFNINYGLAKFQLNTTSKRVNAKALRVLFYMKKEEKSKSEEDVLKWEKEFIKTMKDIQSKLNNTRLVFTAERSMDDAISESASSETPFIAITFAVMITFSCLMLSKFVNPVRGHAWLAISGVLSTGMGILAGIGVAMAFGVPFINLVGVLPFLVLSIGIDDMFIIVDEFDRQSKVNVPSNRVSYALSKVGATIAMTTATDSIAFFVSATSAFPAIRIFCIYTALCINLEFLLQVTLFIAFLTFDSRRIYNSKNDCCPMLEVPDKTCCKLPDQFSFSSRAMHSYAKFLLTRPAKVIVCLISVMLLCFGIYGCLNVDNEFNRKALALKGSYYFNYLTEFERHFPQTIPVDLQITDKLNYSSRAVRNEIASAASLAHNTGYYMSRNFTWVHYFHEFCDRFNIASEGKDFKQAIKLFLSLPIYHQHKLDIILNNQSEVIASRTVIFLKDNPKAKFQKDAMLKLRETLKKKADIKFTAASDPFLYFEQYAIVNKEVINNLISVSLVILIVLIPFCIHPLVILFILIGFITLIVELFGLMYFWDVQLNAISMINLVMAIGFSVDYSAHIAHAFTVSSKSTVNQRITDALVTVGTSVLLGGISTFLGMSFTGFASSNIFQVFFKMFLGIIVFGLFNGVVLLPVLLSIFAKAVTFKTNSTVQPNFSIKSLLKEKLSCLFGSNESDQNAGKDHFEESITVLGMSTRFSDARNKEEFWNLLTDGHSAITDYPDDRYARGNYFEEDFNPTRPLGGRLYVYKGSYMQNIQAFDYKFFGISATEAKSMDPQQRLLLQGTFEAIEDAGLKLEELQNCCTGVYVGIMNLDYSSVVLRDDTMLSIDQFASTGTAFSIAANRLSFALNLNGPSVATDTACSSSLTALSIACDHLRKKKVDAAIVAAANLILCPKKQATICRANMLAPDGKCKVFDERADGYGRGEGIVVFILTRADQFAANATDPYCDILGWGVNNDGQLAAPITAPSVEGQQQLMRDVLLQANVNPSSIQFVEMHGTGTIIGDMVETKSVGEIYGKSRRTAEPVLIGSVKSNVNHTESTAGLAGLAKVCLMLKKKQFVATVGIENQSARLGIYEKGMHVQTENRIWHENPRGISRMAAINSFGYGGSNAHIIVREPHTSLAPRAENKLEESVQRVLVLSARSQSALVDTAATFGNWLESMPDNVENQTDVCYTLSERRTDHSVRLAVSASSLQRASELLRMFADNSEIRDSGICFGKITKQCSKVGFVFGGQGSQWRGMAGDILKNEQMLQSMKKINNIAMKLGHSESLLDYLQNSQKIDDKQGKEKENLVSVQLSIFALQYAVAKFLIMNSSIAPMAVGGHSLGDITAACISGIIKPKEAVKIILARASLQDKCQSVGAMAAIALPVSTVRKIFEDLNVADQLCIAAENDENSVTISGDVIAIDSVCRYLETERKDVFFRKLDTQKAFHSHHMESIKTEFMKQLKNAKIDPKSGQIAFISTTDGRKMYGCDFDDEYWWRNLRNPVLFNACCKEMFSEGCRVIIEISPRPVLSFYVKSIAKQNDLEDVISMQALPPRKENNRLEHMYVHCIGKMYTLGYPIPWSSLQSQDDGKFIRYPLYSWQESELWVKDEFRLPAKTLPFLGLPRLINAKHFQWENEIDLHRFGFLNDHLMKSAGVILPGACYVELALEAALLDTKTETAMVKNLTFLNILPLHERFIRTVQCNKTLSDDDVSFNFHVINVTEQENIDIANAKLFLFNRNTEADSLSLAEALSVQCDDVTKTPEASSETSSDSGHASDPYEENRDSKEIQLIEDSSPVTPLLCDAVDKEGDGSNEEQSTLLQDFTRAEDRNVQEKLAFKFVKQLNREEFKELAAKTGFDFGEAFSLIEHAWSNEDQALVRIKVCESVQESLSKYIVHPCIIDACLQSCIALGSTDPNRQVIPIGIDTVRLNRVTRKIRYLYAYSEVSKDAADSCDVKLLDDQANVILYLLGFRVKDVSRSQRYPVFQKSVYEMNWIADAADESIKKESKVKKVRKWLVLGSKDCSMSQKIKEAVDEISENPQDVSLYDEPVADMVHDFKEKFIKQIEAMNCEDKELIVINLLPIISHNIGLDVDSSSSAHWLCFESSLEALKLLSNNEMELSGSKLVIVTCQNIGYDLFERGKCNIPWSATSLGMARVTNLETKVPVVCVDASKCACKDDFLVALRSLDDHSAEEGLIVSKATVNRPLFQRVTSPQLMKCGIDLPDRRSADGVYLSWSEVNQSYCLKLLGKQQLQKSSEHVDVKLSHVTSPVGQAVSLLSNIKCIDSESCLQSAVGRITAIHDARGNLNIGDEVVALFNSKWVKDEVTLPVYNVFKKPSFLTSEQASVFSGCIALARSILNKVLSVKPNMKEMFIVATASEMGLCWALAVLAKAREIQVFFSENPTNSSNKLPEETTISKITEGHMKGTQTSKSIFDCVVCSSELNPIDNKALVDAVNEGGLIVILDVDKRAYDKQFKMKRSITIMNMKPLTQHLSYQEITTGLEEAFNIFDAKLEDFPNIECAKVSDVCNQTDASTMFIEKNSFSCIEIAHDDATCIQIHPSSMDIQGLKKDRCYIVIGGNRGIGLYTVKWMASRGAGTIITVGRSDVPEETKGEIEATEMKFGCAIKTVKADVSTKDGIFILEDTLRVNPPVAGIVNSAAVLDDKLFKDVDRENYLKVMGPKINGTLLLHDLLERREDDVDFFILYSSITSVLGNTGQTTYAAANAFMNSFADYRKKVLKKPCLSVCWGAMGGAGILERNTKVASLLEKSGLHLLDIPTGLEWMDKVLTTMPQKSNIVICDVDWLTFLRSLPSQKANSIIYDAIRKELPPTKDSGDGELLQMILQAKSMEKRREILLQFIVRWLAAWIGGSEEEIDVNVTLFTYGIDSVGASALKGQIEKDLQIDLEVFYFMQPETTAAKLADDLLAEIYKKFIDSKDKAKQEEDNDEVKEDEDEPLLEKGEDVLELPSDYLSAIYNPPDARAKFFIIHPSHRYVGVFQPLGIGFKFQRLFSLYAFGSPDPAYLGEDIGSVTRLAKACVEMIQEIQPHGPYFLGGYSFGGLVSLEMATILEGRGEKVALVIMIDTVRWLPKGRNNSHLLLDMFDTKFVTEQHIQEQMKGFFAKIATNQLNMRLEEYKQLEEEKSFEEIVEFLSKKGDELSVKIPDIHGILQSTKDDQCMAARCHDEWLPPMNMYRGHVLYIQAEDDRFCKRITAIGSSADCWSSVFDGKLNVMTCRGDHYSMMDSSRAPDIGQILVVAAMLRFRSLFPTVGRTMQSSSQKTALSFFKRLGIDVCLVKGKGITKSFAVGKLKISKRELSLKFKPNAKLGTKCRIHIKDVVNITKLDSFTAKTNQKYAESGIFSLYAGLCLRTKKSQKYKIMCTSRQDFQRLVQLMEATCSIHLPY